MKFNHPEEECFRNFFYGSGPVCIAHIECNMRYKFWKEHEVQK